MRTSEQVWQLRITDRIPPVLLLLFHSEQHECAAHMENLSMLTFYPVLILALIYYQRLQGYLAVKHCRHISEARAHGDQLLTDHISSILSIFVNK